MNFAHKLCADACEGPMGLFFDFKDRAARAEWWLIIIGVEIVLWIVTWAASALLGEPLRSFDLARNVLAAVLTLAVTIRRLHDREKSAWWCVVFTVIPTLLMLPTMMADDPYSMSNMMLSAVLMLVGAPLSLWGLVELGFQRGTRGDNRFGPDPIPAAAE